jgi:branched-chain amino acid aminotransferase
MPLPNYAFFKGKIVPYSEAKVGVMTHTLHYGTGVFGGIRGYWNEDEEQLFVFRPEDHFRRFLDSARLLCMEFPYSESDLTRILFELLRVENFRTNCYIRPLAYFSDEIIGVRLHDLNPEIAIISIPFGSYVDDEEGLHITVSSWRRIDDNMIPARGKITGAYVNSAFAKTDAQRSGFGEALVLNQNGHISEGSAENFFMIRRGVAVTPPVTDNILEGITRRSIIELVKNELGLPVVERSIDRTELFVAEELFMTGTAAQVVAVTRVDFRSVGTGAMGPITTELRTRYEDILRGRNPKYARWTVTVPQMQAAAAR